MLQRIKKTPATLVLILVNVMVFIFTYVEAGSLNGPGWTLTLLHLGAQFNPLTLDKEWYRIFTHMFLHGGIIHLAVNMYALFSVGSEVEGLVGTKKFLFIYFLAGIASALNSLYWSLFSIGVGASGAIFGLFGFSLILNIFFSRQTGRSFYPVLINFAIFVGINLLIAESVNADSAAHFGGLAAGIIIGLYSLARGAGRSFLKVQVEYFIIPILLVIYFVLPRFQVHYYRFFQQVLAAEDSTRERSSHNLSDEQYLKVFTRNNHDWDTALSMLNKHTYLPPALATDTFNLRRYIGLRILENNFKKTMIERESYIYLDSIEHIQGRVPQYLALEFSLNFRMKPDQEPAPPSDSTAPQMIKVLYDSNWVEVPAPPAVFYRIGIRDSLGRWNGIVRDYYNNGDIQMKGSYKQNKRNGVFLYYSDNNTYTSAGRYQDDRSTGKWETYHDNGTLASEVYYNTDYFLKNLWDSLGNPLVIDGNGKEIQRYPNGEIALEGEYRNGHKEGYWYARHATGETYFEENFIRGKLVSGRSRTLDGETFVYDASSLFPLPEEGYEKFHEYVKTVTKNINRNIMGHVKLSFRVTRDGVLTDLNVEQGATPALDARAKRILLRGPRWLPAKNHGHEPVDGFAFVTIEFY